MSSAIAHSPLDLDPNQPSDAVAKADEEAVIEIHPTISCLSSGGSLTSRERREKVDEAESLQDSPYEEVRAAVSAEDDVSMKCNTFRAWSIGLLLVIVFAGVNQFFTLRYPSVTITAIVGQLISFPLGKLLAKFLPTGTLHVRGLSFSLNPGPFNVKEHALIVVMVSVAYSNNYAANILQAQQGFFKQDLSFGYSFCLVLSTQMLGYGLAGLSRSFLVTPAACIWPKNLVSTVLFRTLHGSENEVANGWRVSRLRFFSYVFAGSFFYYFLPGFLFTALSTFTVICWLAPHNTVVNQLFGFNSGLGISPITFDWAMIAYNGSPLATPWFAEANIFLGLVIFFWILTPILYYQGAFYGNYLPLLSSSTFDRYQKKYNVTRVINTAAGGGLGFKFNQTSFEDYSPLYIPSSYSITYALSFASVLAIITHTILYSREHLRNGWNGVVSKDEDVHTRHAKNYRDVPHWWYLSLFVVVAGLAFFTVEYYDTGLPWWGLIIAFAVSAINFLPQGLLEAFTNQHIGLNVITELISGYLLPGRGVANMLFKTYGFITMSQGLNFVADLKLAHYMHLPPRVTFFGQVVATIVGGLVQVLVQRWAFANIANICDSSQSDGFSCPNGRTIYNAAIIWGVVGPQKMFSSGQLYNPLLWFFLFGALIPIPFWLLARRYPASSIWKYVHTPLILSGIGNIPPATGVNYSSYALVGFIFNYLIKRRAAAWWRKYNYILSAALDSGLAIGGVFIFFAIVYPGGKVNWWGNDVFKHTNDYKSVPYKVLKAGEAFGAESWK